MSGCTSARHPRLLAVAVLLVAACVPLVIAGCSSPAPQGDPLAAAITGKVSPWLMAAISRVENGKSPPGMVGHPARIDEQNRLQIDVYTDHLTAADTARLAATGLAGAEPIPNPRASVEPGPDLFQGWATIPAVQAIARLPFVRRITLSRDVVPAS